MKKLFWKFKEFIIIIIILETFPILPPLIFFSFEKTNTLHCKRNYYLNKVFILPQKKTVKQKTLNVGGEFTFTFVIGFLSFVTFVFCLKKNNNDFHLKKAKTKLKSWHLNDFLSFFSFPKKFNQKRKRFLRTFRRNGEFHFLFHSSHINKFIRKFFCFYCMVFFRID